MEIYFVCISQNNNHIWLSSIWNVATVIEEQIFKKLILFDVKFK